MQYHSKQTDQTIMEDSINVNDFPSQDINAFNDSPGSQFRPQDSLNHQPAHHHSASSNHNVTVYQTTGPDAYTSPIPAPGGSGPALNPRSCVTCRRRKVRCDKQMPCSNCRRALIPCVFPAPGRAPRQPRPKDPNAPPKSSTQREAELVKRLKKLEGIVEELSGQIEVESSGKGASSAGSPEALNVAAASKSASSLAGQAHRSATESSGPSPNEPGTLEHPFSRNKDINEQLGRLVLNDHKGSTRYVTNGFWSKLNDELGALREETQRITDGDSDESDFDDGLNDSPAPDAIVPDHQAFIFGYRSADVDLRSCHPLPSHVPFLWSVYQENVDPLVKLLHIPTMDIVMRDARKNPASLPQEMQALVFAIYYSAVTSLEPEEVMTNLGESQEKLLKQYRFALEQALSKANFINTSDLFVLQAFTLFLVTVRRFDDSRFCWTLTGLVIRLGQGMGLHRDGTQFDLTPFETEIRRRLWWTILVLDLRSAEEVGMELTIPDSSFDTQMPLNIDDADISPSSVEAPIPHVGKSDVAITLVRCEILKVSRRFLQDMSSRQQKISTVERENMLIDVYKHVENSYLQYVVTQTDPLWWVAAMVARIIMAKMCLVIYQHHMFPNGQTELSDEIRQRLYVASMEIVELGQKLNVDPRAKQYRWFFMTYTNWHAIAFNLLETCRRPWTALVERSWEAVSGFDRDPVDVEKKADHAAIFLPMRKLFFRARKHREAELARLRADKQEAHRLDFNERVDPAEARFGPLPGFENRMEQMRQKWWELLNDGGAPNPEPTSNSWPQLAVPPLTTSAESPASAPSTTNPAKSYPQQGSASGPVDLSDAAMDYMDDFMTQPNMTMAELWPLNDVMSTHPKNGPGLPMDGPTSLQNQVANDPRMAQVPMNARPQGSAGIGDDHPPPFLWPGVFDSPKPGPGTVNNANNDPAAVDMDMGDFDWQNWGQSLQSLDMGGMQQRPI